MLFRQPLRLGAGGELRGGVDPLRDRRKLDNRVTRAMQNVMKPVRVASNRHLLRNYHLLDRSRQNCHTYLRWNM